MVAFLFGDEDQRESTFFGRYPAPFNPLKAITPPTMNTLLSGGNVTYALVSGESDRYARYAGLGTLPVRAPEPGPWRGLSRTQRT